MHITAGYVGVDSGMLRIRVRAIFTRKTYFIRTANFSTEIIQLQEERVLANPYSLFIKLLLLFCNNNEIFYTLKRENPLYM